MADLLAPEDCFVCGAASGGSALCAACEAELPRLRSACPVCATPTLQGEICGHCLSAPPAFDATHAAFEYAFPVDKMVQALKYRYRLSLVPLFVRALEDFGPFADDAVVLPMPLHVQRLRERGFNQAAEIARPLARRWGLPLELARVARVRDVTPQARLPLHARHDNIKGVFACDGRLDGRTVVVVDDVMTTGATLETLAAVLKRHGASRVVNVVVARTPPP